MPRSVIQYDPALLERICGYFQQFMPLRPNDLAGLMPFCEFRQFEKRAIITRSGEVDDYLNLVVNGLVMKFLREKRGDVILQLATEGHVVASEASFLSREPSQVMVSTLEPTLLVSLRHDRMLDALANFEKGEELGRKILESMYIRKDEKKFLWQSMGVRERFMHYMEHHSHMLQRVPQKYLASYLNIKAETFSRLKHLNRRSNLLAQ
jgi:CRP-like cAMP-binding protein